MIRIAVVVFLLSAATPVMAQDYQAPAGIDAQSLPAPPGIPESNGPISLTPPLSIPPSQAAPSPNAPNIVPSNSLGETAPMPVSPHEGPQERALDQSLGLPTTYVPPDAAPDVKPSPSEDAAIEARINAASHGQKPAASPPVPQPAQTETVYAPASHPSTNAPASSRWEGPEERALDQAVPGTDQLAPQGLPAAAPDSQDEEVRRLNGGN